jgi:hypothetical protein
MVTQATAMPARPPAGAPPALELRSVAKEYGQYADKVRAL